MICKSLNLFLYVDVMSKKLHYPRELTPEIFLHEIELKEVVPFAIKPVTLRFLLGSYQRHGTFREKAELYQSGC
jgi:hypothetical protein